MAQQQVISSPCSDGRRPLRCAWLGPTSGGLAWLFQRLRGPVPDAARLTVEHYPDIDSDVLRRLSQRGGLDRIILACSTRLDYPAREIELLQRDCPDIPLAVACDSWWDGSRRTGLGSIDPLVLPWYRWWDGWTGWLEGCPPELFDPCQPNQAPWGQVAAWAASPAALPGHSRQPSTAEDFPAPPGIIVGNCRRTCEATNWVGQACGFHIIMYSWRKFQQQLAAQQLDCATQWILWDDSCLNTSGPQAARDPMLEDFFNHASRALPSACLIAAVSLPRADQWRWESAGKTPELIVKPDSGQALSRLLMHIRSGARVGSAKPAGH